MSRAPMVLCSFFYGVVPACRHCYFTTTIVQVAASAVAIRTMYKPGGSCVVTILPTVVVKLLMALPSVVVMMI